MASLNMVLERKAYGRLSFLFFFGGGRALPCGMWDLSSLTRDQTLALWQCWAAREVPVGFLDWLFSLSNT